MKERADYIRDVYKKEGETKTISKMYNELEIDLEKGLCVIQDGNNPLVVKEGKGRGYPELSILGKFIIPLFILIPSFFVYLVLSWAGCGILVLTIAFAYFFFPNGIPLAISDESIKFNFKHLLAILVISFLGYYLNKWTYAQTGEVQIAVTIALPILYGLIYYKMKHKKSVREL